MSNGIYNEYTGYHNRKSIRLKGYDYSRPGNYFVTICIDDHTKHLFGYVKDGVMTLNDAGKIVQTCWFDIPRHFPFVTLDEFVVMPNHVHGIITITVSVGAVSVGANKHSPLRYGEKNPKRICGTSKTIGSIVRGFKIGVSKWFREKSPNTIVWQRNYHDRIIRDERSLYFIRQYIRMNPARWDADAKNHLFGEIDRFYPEQ